MGSLKIGVYTIALNEAQFVKRGADSAADADYGPIAWNLLSIACARLGKIDEARFAVNEALKLAPGDERIANNKRIYDAYEPAPPVREEAGPLGS